MSQVGSVVSVTEETDERRGPQFHKAETSPSMTRSRGLSVVSCDSGERRWTRAFI